MDRIGTIAQLVLSWKLRDANFLSAVYEYPSENKLTFTKTNEHE